MFFVLAKILSFFLSPLVWILGLIILAIIVKNNKLTKQILIFTVFVFYFFANGYIAGAVLKYWELNSLYDYEDKRTYDVGIVLSGGVVDYDDETNKLVYGVNSDRIMQALNMYKEGVISKILISGGSGSILSSEYNEAVLVRSFLLNMGLDKNDILIEPNSRNTHENAVETKSLLDEQFPNGKFLLFTSALHMRRAEATFKKEGLNIDIYSTNNVVSRRINSFDFMFFPTALSIYEWESVIHEITGFYTYKLVGYI